MAGKRKIQLHIAAAFLVVCLVGWIILLYAEKRQEKAGWENQFLTNYFVAFNNMCWHLGQFEEAESFEDQLSCLEEFTADMMQLKAYMEMHMELAAISNPKEITALGGNTLGWYEAETVTGFINHGGFINSDPIEAFRADGAISEEEAALLRSLREEIGKLQQDMCLAEEDGADHEYLLPSMEVYERLTEILQGVKAQLVQMNQG